MLGDDLSVWDFLSSMTFPWLLMIFQSSMTFHDFSRKFYFSRFSRFSRPCGNPAEAMNFVLVMFTWRPLDSNPSFHALTRSTHSSREVAMINRTLLCDTMEVSMLSRAWLTIAQHVFQPALTGRPELISRKIVSGELGTKSIAVSRFREQLSPRIRSKVLPWFRDKYRALGRQKIGVQHATAIYPIPRYTRPRYIGSTL